jgi:hypothetical protein
MSNTDQVSEAGECAKFHGQAWPVMRPDTLAEMVRNQQMLDCALARARSIKMFPSYIVAIEYADWHGHA